MQFQVKTLPAVFCVQKEGATYWRQRAAVGISRVTAFAIFDRTPEGYGLSRVVRSRAAAKGLAAATISAGREYPLPAAAASEPRSISVFRRVQELR
jgi:hypothetical protein